MFNNYIINKCVRRKTARHFTRNLTEIEERQIAVRKFIDDDFLKNK